MNGVADSAACRRLKGRRRRKRCDGKARRTPETTGLRRRTRGQVEGADKASAASDAERSTNQSLYCTVAVFARLSEHRVVLRLYSDGRRTTSERHNATLHCRHPGQYRQLPVMCRPPRLQTPAMHEIELDGKSSMRMSPPF